MPEILHLTQPIITSVATLNLSVHKLLQVVVHYVGVEDAATGTGRNSATHGALQVVVNYVGVEDAATGTGRNSATHGVLFSFDHPFLNLHCNVTSLWM